MVIITIVGSVYMRRQTLRISNVFQLHRHTHTRTHLEHHKNQDRDILSISLRTSNIKKHTTYSRTSTHKTCILTGERVVWCSKCLSGWGEMIGNSKSHLHIHSLMHIFLLHGLMRSLSLSLHATYLLQSWYFGRALVLVFFFDTGVITENMVCPTHSVLRTSKLK